jgi:hypothetical protein
MKLGSWEASKPEIKTQCHHENTLRQAQGKLTGENTREEVVISNALATWLRRRTGFLELGSGCWQIRNTGIVE